MAIDPFPAPLVPTDWLGRRLGYPGVKVVDASWYLPTSGRHARQEYLQGHVPGAVFADLDELSDPDTSLPHMFPAPRRFGEQLGRLGLANADAIVVYDGSGANMSAARLWWMLRLCGHERVGVLDGGSMKWRAEGRLLERGQASLPPATYRAAAPLRGLRDLGAMKSLVGSRAEQVVDARAPGRFTGEEPEPRAGLRGGHMPGARSVPYTALVAPDGTLLPPDRLREVFAAAGVALDRPIVTTCGSGVSACAVLLALDVLGVRTAALYDGSWTEWAAQPDTPVERGPAPPVG